MALSLTFDSSISRSYLCHAATDEREDQKKYFLFHFDGDDDDDVTLDWIRLFLLTMDDVPMTYQHLQFR